MCGQHQDDTTTEAPEAAAAPAEAAGGCCGRAAPAADDAAVCPVMAGTPVSKAAAEAAGLFRDHEGVRYWFCCAACVPRFDADPARYAAP